MADRFERLISSTKKFMNTGKHAKGLSELDKRIVRRYSKKFQLQGDKLMDLTDPCQPREVVEGLQHKQLLMQQHHCSPSGAHCGINGTYRKISTYYFWRGMYEDIRQYVSTCIECQKSESVKTQAPQLKSVITKKRPDLGCMDLIEGMDTQSLSRNPRQAENAMPVEVGTQDPHCHQWTGNETLNLTMSPEDEDVQVTFGPEGTSATCPAVNQSPWYSTPQPVSMSLQELAAMQPSTSSQESPRKKSKTSHWSNPVLPPGSHLAENGLFIEWMRSGIEKNNMAKEKHQAEKEKLQAETEKLRLESRKLQLEISILKAGIQQ